MQSYKAGCKLLRDIVARQHQLCIDSNDDGSVDSYRHEAYAIKYSVDVNVEADKQSFTCRLNARPREHVTALNESP